MRRGRSARLMQLVGRAAGRNFLLRRPLRPATLPAASTRLSSIFGVRPCYAKPGVSISYRHRIGTLLETSNTALICRLPPPLCLRPAARLRAGKQVPPFRCWRCFAAPALHRGTTLPALRHRFSAVKALRRGPNSPPRWGYASWSRELGPHFPGSRSKVSLCACKSRSPQAA